MSRAVEKVERNLKLYLIMASFWYFQKESPLDMELHQAAKMGDAKKIKKVLETGRVYVDCQDPEVSKKPSKVIQKVI